MQKEISIKIKPYEALNNSAIHQYLAILLGKNENNITGFYKLKQSIDARSRQQVWINLTLKVFIDEPYQQRAIQPIFFKDVTKKNKKVIIIGAGPAGLFAALKLLELGIKPIILERGKNIQSRRRDLAILNKEGIVNPESNYCF
nr:FAD-dependent monooxygenase [Chitinophagaceae bacterium]